MALLNLHTHEAHGGTDVVEIVNQYPDAFDDAAAKYSIGIHPWRIDQQRLESDLDLIAAKLPDGRCMALGECGLDKRIETPLQLQIEVFGKQLELALRWDKPVIVHCVAAFDELIAIKRDSPLPMIVHGYSKSAQLARQLVDSGFYLSFGKWLLRNPELEGVFRSVPDERIFLETDTANESIEDVYELAARYKRLTRTQMEALVWRNYQSVFKTA